MSTQVIGSQVQRMFGTIAARYDVTNTVLSFGIHHLWKRLVVSSLTIPPDSTVLDLCTGTGDLLPLLRARFKRVIGADFCFPMLKVGRERPGHDRYPVLQGDALRLPFSGGMMDGITVAFGVRNLESLAAGLSEMRRVLKPGGLLAVLEFGQPGGALFGPIYRMYSKHLMPIIGGLLTGNRDAYRYLPETARAFPCGKAFEEQLRSAGYEPLRTKRLSFGIAFLYLARNPG